MFEIFFLHHSRAWPLVAPGGGSLSCTRVSFPRPSEIKTFKRGSVINAGLKSPGIFVWPQMAGTFQGLSYQ